jgi:hypothetical protein
MDGFEMAVFTSQPVDVAVTGGGGRWRRRPRARAYGWHLLHAERPLTWCGLHISYTEPRRPWSEIPEDQRCQNCVGRLERVSHTDTAKQRTL